MSHSCDCVGFYHLLLKLTNYETDPEAFFQILEVDRQIGWIHQVNIETNVFRFKAIKIIEDEQVSYKISFLQQI